MVNSPAQLHPNALHIGVSVNYHHRFVVHRQAALRMNQFFDALADSLVIADVETLNQLVPAGHHDIVTKHLRIAFCVLRNDAVNSLYRVVGDLDADWSIGSTIFYGYRRRQFIGENDGIN